MFMVIIIKGKPATTKLDGFVDRSQSDFYFVPQEMNLTVKQARLMDLYNYWKRGGGRKNHPIWSFTVFKIYITRLFGGVPWSKDWLRCLENPSCPFLSIIIMIIIMVIKMNFDFKFVHWPSIIIIMIIIVTLNIMRNDQVEASGRISSDLLSLLDLTGVSRVPGTQYKSPMTDHDRLWIVMSWNIKPEVKTNVVVVERSADANACDKES